MAKTREIVCIHYVNKGTCDLGKEASFYGLCQTCSQYKKKPGAKPNRINTKRQKIEKALRKERWQ